MADGFIERISLCRVSRTKDKDDKTTLWLMRLADVESKYDEDVQPLEIIRIPSADSGRFVLKDSVHNLPLYSFSPDDTITIDGKIFYMSLECGEHLRMELMKNPMEIVRGIILQRILPAKVKALNLPEITKSKWKEIRAFITGLPADSIYHEIQSACLCSEDEARDYIGSFFHRPKNI